LALGSLGLETDREVCCLDGRTAVPDKWSREEPPTKRPVRVLVGGASAEGLRVGPWAQLGLRLRLAGDEPIGFVNLAWDGGIHAFVLDTTVHPNVRRRGVGRGLVELAVEVARERGVEWVHVDFDGHLREFYYECGFRRTEAGLLHLNRGDEDR
jgi:GNAT superfamily N-acetyltransferase